MKLRIPLIGLFFVMYIITIHAGSIKGVVMGKASDKPIAFATVALINRTTNELITGATTNENGSFNLITKELSGRIEISFLGYEKKVLDNIELKDAELDLKTIYLIIDTHNLTEVVITGEVSESEFKLDKRVFNVGKDLSTSGLGALDVLSNVPSVNVNIEGQVSLRGSTGVQMLINGKPSVLTSGGSNALGSITADMIERIEVITNPSAKYDAEGTSGIINIVLKKEEKKGANGSISVNTGIPNNHSIGFSINQRTDRFNLFSQMGIGKRTYPRENESENIDLSTNDKVLSTGYSERNESFMNVMLGTDYLINNNNVITLSGSYAYEKEDNPSEGNFKIYENNVLMESYDRIETSDAGNPKFQYELQYKRDFERNEDQNLLISAIGSSFAKIQESDFVNTYDDGTEGGKQQTYTDYKQADYTFKLDYTHPFKEFHTIETGAQFLINDVHNNYLTSIFENGDFVIAPDLSNNFSFNQNVLAFYGTYGFEQNKWGVKVGLRIENTDVTTLLENTDERNAHSYTDYFPSAHTSFKISKDLSLQAGYSRRIYRPRLRDLNPFLNIQNVYNLRTGNPDLDPEYTDSYEFTGIYKLGKLSLNAGVYYRYTTDVIERVITYQGNVSLTRPENFGTNQSTGIEFNSKYTPSKWLTLNLDWNYENYNRMGTFEETSFDFTGNRWTGKLMGKIALPFEIDFELTGNYNSSYETVQQNVSETLFMDAGLRKKLWKGKVIANLSVRDVFASRIYESYTLQEDFYQNRLDTRGRFITFGISYGFGKGEAMTYSGGKR